MSTDLLAENDRLEAQVLAAIAGAQDEAALEVVRIGALGKKGSISAMLATLGKMSPDERRTQGVEINALKDKVTDAIARRRTELKQAALATRLATETVDVTLPVRPIGLQLGRIHPISQVTEELTVIFADMGFSIAEGPDIETDDYNFTKLNFPAGHPARDMHDTFFLTPDRTASASSCARIRARCRCARCCRKSRRSALSAPAAPIASIRDQTHTPMFHQVEGLVIDRSAHLGHLKWILEEFCKAFFEVPT